MLIHLLYYLFAGLVAMAALSILWTPHIIYAALYLVGVSIGLSAIYFLQGASFIAVVYLIMYAGGAIVVVLFALLFFKPTLHKNKQQFRLRYRLLTALCLSLCLLPLLKLSMNLAAQPNQLIQSAASAPTVTQLGYQLLGPYAWLFEMTSILLLVVLIGALYIIRNTKQNK